MAVEFTIPVNEIEDDDVDDDELELVMMGT